MRAKQAEVKSPGIRELLLTRRGVAFVESRGERPLVAETRAVELELAGVGYVFSSRLSRRLAESTVAELGRFREWAVATLLAHLGGDRKHTPLFRKFPDDVPHDTTGLWWDKVLVHYLQAEDQPCITCDRVGTTHVLRPCLHVVCDRCFDGSNYSACPVCEQRVDTESPFFAPAPDRPQPAQRVVFKLIDLGQDAAEEARALFVSLCERRQALSPADRDTLVTLTREFGSGVLPWLPAEIPVRENVAVVFGTLLQLSASNEVMAAARRFLSTATDVLRLIAVISGTDGSLQSETVFKAVERLEVPQRFLGRMAKLFGARQPEPWRRVVQVPVQVHRFKVAKLPRALRRALLAMLEELHPTMLTEDMLRHRSYWVWVGEFLHPHEYARRFPKVARAFQIVRGKDPDGGAAPEFRTWYSKVDQAISSRETDQLLRLVLERPGEFARRFDHVLRSAGDDTARARVVQALGENAGHFATPVLLTLRAHLPSRSERSAVRVFWPKGRVARGVSAPDTRATLRPASIQSAVRVIDAELLARFATQTNFDACLLDVSLRDITVPFNERTASRAAVFLPRGSRLPVSDSRSARLFLHWCQPELQAGATDLDLSVAFYNERWEHVGVCSWYELTTTGKDGKVLARSSGDLRNAPWPDGATEFVDFDRAAALDSGIRYAVMVVTNYSGLAFSQLERAFAGLMLRDDPGGHHFDPRAVELKFSLEGENGVFLPLVFDLREGVLHWLDVHARGMFDLNSVAASNHAIVKICPEQMQYFASGVRASMFDLGLMHAAARCRRVWLRDRQGAVKEFVRRPDEDASNFHARLVSGVAEPAVAKLPGPRDPALLALLFRGDLELPDGSLVYALFRERLTPSLAASDLLS